MPDHGLGFDQITDDSKETDQERVDREHDERLERTMVKPPRAIEEVVTKLKARIVELEHEISMLENERDYAFEEGYLAGKAHCP